MLDVTHYPFIEVDYLEDLNEALDLYIWKYPDWEFGIRHASLKIGQRNLNDAYNLLFDATNILLKNKIKYWLNWGTLLGMYRDHNFIKWDTDIDITCHWEDRDRVLSILEPALKSLGCFIPKPEICYPEDRWYIRDKEKIELNFVESVGDKYVYSPNRCKLGCPKHYIDTLDITYCNGIPFYIPSDTENYLRLSYGSTWRTPLKGVKPVTL